MKPISLTEDEIKHIRETYIQELERLEKRSSEISVILKKLKGTEMPEEQNISSKPEKLAVKTSEKPAKTGRGRRKKIVEKIDESAPLKTSEGIKAKRGRPAKKKIEEFAGPAESTVTKETKVKGKRGRKPKALNLADNKKATTKRSAKAEKPAKAARTKRAKTASATPARRGRKKRVETAPNAETTGDTSL